MTELSDELLVAYVDGQLQRAQSLAIEKVLEQDEVLAARVDALRQAHARLESAFDAILSGAIGDVMAAVPIPPPRPAAPRQTGLTKIGIAVAGVGLALAALVAGYGWPLVTHDQETPQRMESATALASTWQDRALNAQALLDRASVEVSPDSQANEDLVALQMAQALGPDFKLPNLDADGFKFARGQLLSFDGRPLAQLLYLGKTKPPLALYATPDPAGTAGAQTFRRVDALGALSWSEGGLAYLLTGDEDEATLRRLAASIRNGGASAASPSPGTDPVVTGSH
jgi:anti-sigma factor RsiW